MSEGRSRFAAPRRRAANTSGGIDESYKLEYEEEHDNGATERGYWGREAVLINLRTE